MRADKRICVGILCGFALSGGGPSSATPGNGTLRRASAFQQSVGQTPNGTTCDATLTIGSAPYVPGVTAQVDVPVFLTNNETIRGFEVDVVDLPDVLNLTGCVSSDPAFDCQTSPTGSVLWVSFSADVFPSGANQIAVTLTYTISPSATGTVTLTPENLLVADQNNNQCPSTGVPGSVGPDGDVFEAMPVDDTIGTREGEPVTIDVLANDSGIGLTITEVGNPSNGTVVDNADGTLTYTPNPGFSGEDSFTYTVVDEDGISGTATVQVSVGLSGIPGLDPNEQEVAEALDRACNTATGDLAEVCEELQQSGDSDAIDAINEIAPEKVAAQGTSVVEATSTQLGNVRNRLTMLRLGAAGPGMSDFSVNLGGKNLPLGSIIDSLRQGARQNAQEDESIASGGRLGFFINGRANFGDKDTTTNEVGFDFQSQGLTLGLDYRFSSQVVFGGALGYAKGDADFAGSGGELESSSWQLSAYGSYYPSDKAYIDWIVGYGVTEFDMMRNIIFGMVNTFTEGSTDGQQQSVSISGGWDFGKKGWAYAPYLRADFITVDIDGYTEIGGSGLSLIIGDQDIDSLSTALSGRFAKTLSRRWGVFTTGLRFEWEHEYKDDNRLIAASFSENPLGGVFMISTDDPDRDFFNIGINFAATFSRGKALFFDYERVVGLNDVTSNTINVGFRMEF